MKKIAEAYSIAAGGMLFFAAFLSLGYALCPETMQGGNTTERYHELLAMVLSDMEESELEKVLLMAAGSNKDRDVEKNAT